MNNQSEKKDPVTIGKEIEYYSVFLNSWITNRMELDKHLLTLSTAGIGALLLLKDSFKDYIAFGIWIATGLSFLACVGLILKVFRGNADYIETFINSDDQGDEKLSDRIAFKTKLASWLFITGVSLTIVLTIYTTAISIHEKGKEPQMSEQTKGPSGTVPLREGVEGAGALKPSNNMGSVPCQKGLEGASNLKPQSQSQSNNSGQSSQSKK